MFTEEEMAEIRRCETLIAELRQERDDLYPILNAECNRATIAEEALRHANSRIAALLYEQEACHKDKEELQNNLKYATQVFQSLLRTAGHFVDTNAPDIQLATGITKKPCFETCPACTARAALIHLVR